MRAIALAAFLLGGCAATGVGTHRPTFASQEAATGTWRPVDADTSGLTGVNDLEELAAAFPDSATVQLRLLSAYAQAEEADKVLSLLPGIVGRGYRFSSAGEAQIRALLGDRVPAISLTMHPDEAMTGSSLAATVPPNKHVVESALRERGTGRIYITSIVSRGLFREVGSGAWERVPLGGVGSLAGLVQDPDGTIWTASAAYDATPDPESVFRGLVGFEPITGVVRRIAAPVNATPSDIAVASDGTLFAADPLNGAIYRAAPDARELSVLVPPGNFRSAQGLAPSADGRFLYVSDYGYGLARVDLASGRVDRLPAPNSPFVDGTDGLWLHDGWLVAIQNGTRPMRIVAHRLAADGRAIVETRVLEQAHPEWTEPGSGSIAGDALIYVATGQWDRFEKGGLPIDGKPPLPTAIRLLPLGGKTGFAEVPR